MIHSTIAHLGLLEDEAIVLDSAALELAALDHPGTDLPTYTDVLATIAERVAISAGEVSSATDQARTLAQVIAHEFGFQGDRLSYDDPANADLIRVMDRKRGLPVSLTILYVAAARRISWSAAALNTPGHVLCRIGTETDRVLIDPFNLGAFVDAQKLTGLLSNMLGSGAAVLPEYVEPMSNRETLVRLLMNQASRAEQKGDLSRALELYTRMTIVSPDQGHPWWERARLEVAHADPQSARSSLSSMLELTREPATRNHICAALDALAQLD